MEHKVKNVRHFLNEQNPQDVVAWGYAADREALLDAIKGVVLASPEGFFKWMVWKPTITASGGRPSYEWGPSDSAGEEQ